MTVMAAPVSECHDLVLEDQLVSAVRAEDDGDVAGAGCLLTDDLLQQGSHRRHPYSGCDEQNARSRSAQAGERPVGPFDEHRGTGSQFGQGAGVVSQVSNGEPQPVSIGSTG